MRDPYPMIAATSRACRAVLVLALALTLAACGKSSGDEPPQGKGQQMPPVPVKIEKIEPKTVDVYEEYPGRVQGKRTVQVLARVEGVLQKKHYTEGQLVNKGQLLYTIDPKPFQATVNQRKAELASAKASLNEAQRQYRRVRQLFKANAVSEAERDQALSQLETARASVQQANANLDSAQIDLGYTKVSAPLTGVTSLRETDEGALVNNGTRLTTITQLDPVYVLFALPEDDAIGRSKALSAMGGSPDDAATRAATVILPGGKTFSEKGEVDFTQSTIDPETGTVQLRAVVANPDNQLMPGRFVRARIRLQTRENAIVVPSAAISSGEQRTQVFTMVDGKAKPVTVELGPSVDSGQIIAKGLSKGDRVITSGLGQIKPGAPVKPKSAAHKPDKGSGKAQPARAENAESPDRSGPEPAKNTGDRASGQAGRGNTLAAADYPALRVDLRRLVSDNDAKSDAELAANRRRAR